MPSSRATTAAETRPPRVTQTIASNGPAPLSRHANARESRWNWSHDTGNILSGLRGGLDCCGSVNFSSVMAMVSSSLAGLKLGPHPRQHRFDRAFGGSELLRIARPHHHIGIAAAFVHERIGADDDVGMLFGDLAEFGADIAFAAIGAHRIRQHFDAG